MSNKLVLSKELIGRRALVTGGTRGIGAAIAQRLLDAGAKVVVAARTRNDDTPAETRFVSGDVTTSEGVDAIATEALAALGGLDILVNNAGGGGALLGGSWTIPDKEWHDAFALNLFAAIRLTNAVLPALRASNFALRITVPESILGVSDFVTTPIPLEIPPRLIGYHWILVDVSGHAMP